MRNEVHSSLHNLEAREIKSVYRLCVRSFNLSGVCVCCVVDLRRFQQTSISDVSFKARITHRIKFFFWFVLNIILRILAM